MTAFEPAKLARVLAELDASEGPAQTLAQLVRQGLDQLPLPAHGATWPRWQALSVVAEHDLSLVKLYEGHVDALAVQAEVAPWADRVGGATWGMWAAEPPSAKVQVRRDGHRLRLDGRKAWCSGAAVVSQAPARGTRGRPMSSC